MINNLMTVDVEDYYCDLPFSEWDKYKNRIGIVDSTLHVLDLLQEYMSLPLFSF
jgi:hypothetical protein